MPCRPRILSIWLRRRATKAASLFKTCLPPCSLCLLSRGYWRVDEGLKYVFSTLLYQDTESALYHLLLRLLAPFQAFARPSIHLRSQVHSFRRRGGTQALLLHGNAVIPVSIPSRSTPYNYGRCSCFEVYEQYGNDTISFISFLVGPSAIHTANIDVVRQVTASGGTKGFHKPPEASTGIKYGRFL